MLTDMLVARVLPAVLFGLATGGLLWLVGLVRKRAALACALALAAAFLPARWDGAILVTAQFVVTAIACRALRTDFRFRVRDVIALSTAAVLASWGLLTGFWPVYWFAAMTGALAGTAAMLSARVASERFSGAPLRLLSLRPAKRGGVNGPGVVTGLVVATVLVGIASRLGVLGPGEPGLVLASAAIGAVAADTLRGGAPGLVLLSGFTAGLSAVGLVAFLP